jgi:hypothetical protein
MLFLWLMACSSDKAAYAVNVMSVQPDQKGLSGTQTWQFFNSAWARHRLAKNFLCARAQEITGIVIPPPSGCSGCDNAYKLTAEDIDSDCATDEATNPGYKATLYIAIGKVSSDISDMDPHSGESLGWYLSTDGEDYEPWGFAYDERLDKGEDPGVVIWSSDGTYTLMPAVALEL